MSSPFGSDELPNAGLDKARQQPREEARQAAPELATSAVLVESQEMPADAVQVRLLALPFSLGTEKLDTGGGR